MLRNFFSLYFWVTLVALGMASGLTTLEVFRVAESEVRIVMLPKATTAVAAPGNAAALITSDGFASTVKSELDLVKYSETLRGEEWKDMVSATVLPGSSTLMITVTTDERLVTERIMKLIIKELPVRLSQWYDMRTEIDMRLLDNPSYQVKVGSWTGLIALSMSIAFVLTTLFFGALAWLHRSALKRRVETRSEYHISPETFRPSPAVPYWSQYPTEEAMAENSETPVAQAFESKEELTFDPIKEEEEQEQREESLYQEPTVALESVFQEEMPQGDSEREVEAPLLTKSYATAQAPDNLPIMDDLSPLEGATARLFKSDIDTTTELQSLVAEAELNQSSTTGENETGTAEPTQEEYKKRLNQLLSGRL